MVISEPVLAAIAIALLMGNAELPNALSSALESRIV